MRIKNWHDYWRGKTTPLHCRDEPDFFARYANELKVLLDGRESPRSVLDLGCGNGALFEPLGFDGPEIEYLGVDFSQSMLDDFRRRRPDVKLVAGDAARFCVDRTFDLIFSSGLVQYFSAKMMESHLALCRSMMTPSSTLVHAAIPWARQKWLYRAGWGPGRDPYPGNRLKRYLRPLYSACREQMGKWHRPQQLARMAARQGLTCQIFGSVHYIYRFHVLLQRA